MNSENNSRTVELTVSRQSIVDKYAEWLAATKIVLPNEEVTNIQFNDLFKTVGAEAETLPIKVFIKTTTPTTKEVTVKPETAALN